MAKSKAAKALFPGKWVRHRLQFGVANGTIPKATRTPLKLPPNHRVPDSALSHKSARTMKMFQSYSRFPAAAMAQVRALALALNRVLDRNRPAPSQSRSLNPNRNSTRRPARVNPLFAKATRVPTVG